MRLVLTFSFLDDVGTLLGRANPASNFVTIHSTYLFYQRQRKSMESQICICDM